MADNFIAYSALILAILSPFATALLNNRHTRKMYELKTVSEGKSKAIEKYIDSLGIIFTSNDGIRLSSLQTFSNETGKIYIYISKENWCLIDEMHGYIRNRQLDRAKEVFPLVCKALADELRV